MLARTVGPSLARTFTEAMKIGIAPALHADPRKSFWGGKVNEGWSYKQKNMLWCNQQHWDPNFEDSDKLDERHIAREAMQCLIAPKGNEKMPETEHMREKVTQAPEKAKRIQRL